MSKEALQAKDMQGLGFLQRAFDLLGSLHDVGCERDTAGNRKLFYDDYVNLVLLYIWNPLIESLRDLQHVAQLPKVAEQLGVEPFSLGSFSESVRVFEPEFLQNITLELAKQLPAPAKDPRLSNFHQTLTLVDGTVIRGLTRLVRSAVGADAKYNTSRDGKEYCGWRLHTQLDLHTITPRIVRTGARNAGPNRESNVLAANLQPDHCYVDDGGYADRKLYQAIVKANSSYITRAKENSVCVVVEERVLDKPALDAGVVRDAIVRLEDEAENPLGHTLRRIEIQVTPHPRRRRGGFQMTDVIILYTCLLDLEPELVGLIYRWRYLIEGFFLIFKQLLGMRHLLSQREEGIDIQIQCTLIVCILIQLISGKKPNKATRNIIGWYLLGLADEQDVIRFLNKPDRTGVKLRAAAEARKKLGY